MPSERIQLLIDVVTGGSTRSTFAKLKTDLASAETGFAKVKVASKAGFDFIKQHAALFAVGAATAIATFADKAVHEFQKVALGAGLLRDKLGLTAEEASRLQVVAGDLGIGVDTMASALGKMNRAAANTPEAFSNIGAAIARSADGTTDVNQTFLNTIEALNKIPDATQRAAAAQKIFGRGWQSISELVGMGAEQLQEKLNAVGDAEIVSDEEIAKAREMRDRFAELGHQAEAATLVIGETLLPAVSDVAAAASQVLGPFAKVVDKINELRASSGDAGSTGFGDNLKKFFFGSLPGQIDHVTGLVHKFHDQMKDAFGGGVEGTFKSDVFEKMGSDIADAGIHAAQAAGQTQALADATQKLADANQAVSDPQVARNAAEHADMLTFQANKARDAASNMEALRAVLEAKQRKDEEAAQAARDHADALEAEGQAALDEADAFRAASDAGFALRKAQRDAQSAALDLADATKKSDEAQADGSASAEDRTRALLDVANAQDNVITSADAVADAEVRVRDERAKTAGATLSATQKLDLFNKSLLNQAATASGPVRQALVDHIAELNAIPPKKASEILALIDEGKLHEAKQKIDDASAPRHSTVTFDADTSAANAARDAIDNPIYVPVRYVPGGPIPRYQSGGHHSGGLAVTHPGESFTPDSSGGTMMLLPSGTVHNAAATASAGSRGRAKLQSAEASAVAADKLRDEAAALKELAKNTDDAKEKQKLLEQANTKLARASDLTSKATDKATASGEAYAKTVADEERAMRRDTETLLKHADALNKQADAFRERASSSVDAVDAFLQVQDAEDAAAEASRHAAEAFRVEGVTAEQKQQALNDAKQAALALAEADVQAARERAQAEGRRFSLAAAERVRQRSLQRQAEQGGPVGQAIRQMIRQIDFPRIFRDFQKANKRDADAREARGQAKQLEHAADRLDHLASVLPDTFANVARAVAAGRISDAEFDRRIRHALHQITSAARAGRK